MDYADEIDTLHSEQFLKAYVRPWSGNPAAVVSTLAAALRDARQMAGRDLDNGLPRTDVDEHSSSWLAAVGYLVVLDQLGAAIRPKGVPEATGNAFVRALKYFARDMEPDDIEAIYGLRCALVHDYSLVHKGQGRKPSFHFRLVASDSDPLVKHAAEPWTFEPGFPDDRERTATAINLRELASLVEQIVDRVRALAKRRQLAIALDGGNNALAVRYFVQIREEP